MRVQLETSGGFTGLRQVAELDTAELGELAGPAQEALGRLAGRALQAPTTPEPRYTLNFEHDGREHRVVLTPSQVPDELRPLVSQLLHRAGAPGYMYWPPLTE